MDMKAMMAQMRKLQAEVAQAQAALAAEIFTVEKQGVRVTMTGARRVTAITINPVLLDPTDPELVADLLMLALNEALANIKAAEAAIEARAAQGGR